MTISIGCAVFFVFAIFIAGMMFMAILLAGAEKRNSPPAKIIRISEDIEGSIVEPNFPGWKPKYN